MDLYSKGFVIVVAACFALALYWMLAPLWGAFACGSGTVADGGAALVWVPAVVFLVVTSQWGWAIFMLVWGMGVSVSDNLMRPLLISTQAPVSRSPYSGLIIGPVLLIVLVALLRFLDETLSRQPGSE